MPPSGEINWRKEKTRESGIISYLHKLSQLTLLCRQCHLGLLFLQVRVPPDGWQRMTAVLSHLPVFTYICVKDLHFMVVLRTDHLFPDSVKRNVEQISGCKTPVSTILGPPSTRHP